MGTLDAWPPAPEGVTMVGYAIYMRPLDFPDNWVVRRWFVVEGQDKPVFDVVPRLANVLDEARRHVPPGLTCLIDDRDDPFLFEFWM
jgi:hypothetical protein